MEKKLESKQSAGNASTSRFGGETNTNTLITNSANFASTQSNFDNDNDNFVFDCAKQTEQSGLRNFRPWTSLAEFSFVSINSVVGLSNTINILQGLLKFGPWYLVHYVLVVFLLILPVHQIETAMAQYSRMDAMELMFNICPILCGIGWLMIISVSFHLSSYAHEAARCLWYAMVSVSTIFTNNDLPWNVCAKDLVDNETSCLSCDITTLKVTGKPVCEYFTATDSRPVEFETMKTLNRSKLFRPAIVFLFGKIYKFPLEHLTQLQEELRGCYEEYCELPVFDNIDKKYSCELIACTVIVLAITIVSLWNGLSAWAKRTQYITLVPTFGMLFLIIEICGNNTNHSVPSMFWLNHDKYATHLSLFTKAWVTNVIDSFAMALETGRYSMSLSFMLKYQIGQRLQYESNPLSANIFITLIDTAIGLLYAVIGIPCMNAYHLLYQYRTNQSQEEVIFTRLNNLNVDVLYVITPSSLRTISPVRSSFMAFLFYVSIFIMCISSLIFAVDGICTALQIQIYRMLKLFRNLLENKFKMGPLCRVVTWFCDNCDRIILVLLASILILMGVPLYCNNHFIKAVMRKPAIESISSVMVMLAEFIFIFFVIGVKKWQTAMSEMHPPLPNQRIWSVLKNLLDTESISTLIRFSIAICLFTFLAGIQLYYWAIKSYYWHSINFVYMFTFIVTFCAVYQIVKLLAIQKQGRNALIKPTKNFKPAREFMLTPEEMKLFKVVLMRKRNTMQAQLDCQMNVKISPSLSRQILRNRKRSTKRTNRKIA